MVNVINSKEIVARLLTSYNITHRGWLSLTPLWINDCLSEIDIPSVWELVREIVNLEDGACLLPCNIKLLEGIKYKGYNLRLYSEGYNPVFLNHSDSGYDTSHTVTIENGYVVTDIEPEAGYSIFNEPNSVISQDLPVSYEEFNALTDAEKQDVWNTLRPESSIATTNTYALEFTYRRLKTEFDQELGVAFPMILDNDLLKQALQYYIISKIMMQGLKVSPFVFDRNQPDLNPNILFEKYAKQVRNNISFTPMVMTEIHAMANTMILNYKKTR